jgi:apolipoprotein N-acyltransferase
MSKLKLLLLSVSSGLIFTLSWPMGGFPGLIFFAFIPLLFLQDELQQNPGYSTWHALFLSYPGFFTWNILTTWWIYNSTGFGVTMAVFFNSLFMSLVFTLYHATKKKLQLGTRGLFILPLFWISFEYLHMRWDLTWSWLNIGHAFAYYPRWIQWYEYTGIFGGALWVFAVNILLYMAISGFLREKALTPALRIKVLAAAGMFALPLIFSYVIYFQYEEKSDPVNVVVVQPNIDPYKEQYSLPPHEVMAKIFGLASQKMDQNTDFLVAPESAIQENIWEDNPSSSYTMFALRDSLQKWPKTAMVIGASTYWRFADPNDISATARWSADLQSWYDAYNTAVFMNSKGKYQTYHKSKLVVGVERMPFPKYLKFLESYALDLGGTVGSLGISENRTAFHDGPGRVVSAATICYESVYGEFFTGFVKNGAKVMFIITNDGWWGNTAGHKQHLGFAAIRAIENRRSIARSANTGISCFVDQRGEMHQQTKYWEQAVIRGTINANDKLTFYTRYGDYAGRWALGISGAILLFAIVFRNKYLKKQNI